MSFFIGMDEAGYGPNLGPLVITATLWEVPGDPCQFDFWKVMEPFVTQSRIKNDPRLHIADSKKVYSPSRGLSALERSILMTLQLGGLTPGTLHQLASQLTFDENFSLNIEPWFFESDLELPLMRDISPEEISLFEDWQQHCNHAGVKLHAVKSDIVLTERFNKLVQQYNNKALALSHCSLQLLSQIWDKQTDEKILIVADKHGGRNRYGDLLATIVGENKIVFRHEEGKSLSRYSLRQSEIRFQTKAEEHFPVAVASMVCKYVRELSMELFNRFWQKQTPHLKSTKGYPQDARRFKQEILEKQQALNIPEKQLWRIR